MNVDVEGKSAYSCLPFLVTFNAVTAKFIKLTVLGINGGRAVCLDELEVFAPESTENLALDSMGGIALVSSFVKGNPDRGGAYLIDGKYGNDRTWMAESGGIEWAQIELPCPTIIDAIAFSRDREGHWEDCTPTSFKLEVSVDGKDWTAVAIYLGPGVPLRGAIKVDRCFSNWCQLKCSETDILPIRLKSRQRCDFVDAKQQSEPAGKSICLNGINWWMRQVIGEPHLDEWLPETNKVSQFLDELPKDGFGEGTEWVCCTVPGSVQSALFENGLFEREWYEGERIRALEKATVGKQSWFFKRFNVPMDWGGNLIKLRFGAVDYRANFYLNSSWIGTHEGHFSVIEFDVAKFIKIGQENILTVQIDAFPYESPVDASEVWPLRAQFARSQVLVNARSYDFAPAVCPLGITEDVHLLAADKLFIEDIWVRSELNSDFSSAKLLIEAMVESTAESVCKVQIDINTLQSPMRKVSSQFIAKLRQGENILQHNVEITAPQLWWPNGSGPQNLYSVEFRVFDSKGQTLHIASEEFGVRSLEKAFNEGHDMSPYPWTFVINGQKIYVKGGGWVPADIFHRMELTRYEQLLYQAKSANFNAIRWWGGGVRERKGFYKLCDRLGLMVIQDMFLGNAEHDNPRFLKLLEKEVTSFVRLLRKHPSVVQYTGGNELFNGTINYHVQAKLWDVVPKLDPTRPFYPSSPTIGQKHAISDYYYNPDRDYSFINRYGSDPELSMKIRSGKYPDWQIIGQPQNDYYMQWINRLKLMGFDPDNPDHHANAFDVQFTGEGGSSTVANFETLRKIIPENELCEFDGRNPSSSWLFHNAKPGYYDWLQHERKEEIFGHIKDLETYVVASQFASAQILAYGLEEMRRRKFKFSGTLMWQFNEPWPNAAGNALLDYFSIPRITYDFVQKAYQSIHVSLRFEAIKWEGSQRFNSEIWATNDLFEDRHDCTVVWKILDESGNLVSNGEKTFFLRANSSVQIDTCDWLIPSSYDSFFVVYCEIYDNDKKDLLSQNDYVFSAHTTTRNFLRPLLTASKTNLKFEMMDVSGNVAKFRVTNTGTSNALICRVAPEERFDDVVMLASANSFSLAPFAKREVLMEAVSLKSSKNRAYWDNVMVHALNAESVKAIKERIG